MTSPIEEKIKSTLDNSVHDLDAETLHRLQTIRREALNQPARKGRWSSLSLWAPAAGFAMCALMAAVLWLPQFNAPIHTVPTGQTAMFELLDGADIDEALDDPGFYLWLDEQEEVYG